MLFLGERKEGEQMCKRKNKRKKNPKQILLTKHIISHNYQHRNMWKKC